MADGGLYTVLLESVMPKELGFDVEADKNFRTDAFLFGESKNCMVVSVATAKQAGFEKALQNKAVNFTKLGSTTGHGYPISGIPFGGISMAKKHYDTALEQIFD